MEDRKKKRINQLKYLILRSILKIVFIYVIVCSQIHEHHKMLLSIW